MPTFTVIPVLYRDAFNYKAHGSIAIRGDLSSGDLGAVRGALIDQCWADVEKLGWRHLAAEWPTFPSDEDHPLHEVLVDEARSLTAPENLVADDPLVVLTLGELLKALADAR